jgi:hypothetical protein
MYVLYYASMLRCWHLVWILVRTNHPSLVVGCHSHQSSKTHTGSRCTFTPVARLTTIHVLLSLAASHSLLVHQVDVNTAFLNGELEEEIYMT